MDARIERLTARRQAVVERRRAITDAAERTGREELTLTEDADFRRLTSQLGEYDERIAELREETGGNGVETEGSAALRRVQASGRNGALADGPYGPGSRHSYFIDLARRGDDFEAQQRLAAYAAERRDLNRTDGTGGYFVPPLWLMNQWVEKARAGRPYADLCTRLPLPGGTDSINIPKVATGAAAAIQTADNAAVSDTDLTDTSIEAKVRTIAGQQDVAIQLLDQSPVSFDEVIFRDLIADYATKTDLQVISGSGSSGQVTGVRSTSGITTITYTSATPKLIDGSTTANSLIHKLADAVQRIATSRFAPADAIVMHPRRWAWVQTQVDSQNRAQIVPGAAGPSNAFGISTAPTAEGAVGMLAGLPVFVDSSIPTNLGAGTNEDVIHVLRASDLLLWESGIRTRVLPEVGSGTLTVRLQVYGYLAFTAARQPQSVVEVGGTGLVPPTF
ncbi:MAG TPA: phage major capsid protein [Streptosporangiaceae bacterium]|jgi:HK97 family phage major capsid protein